ncbi:MAG: methionyl-tRNA formyltransferase [Deltaproteobacteria bacterium]|nr:methionyl-tRNA formyltransferase [Deltaproteobacteria bacterium]
MADLSGLKVVFMGTPAIALESLKALIGSGAKIEAVVTQKPKPKGRGKKMSASPVNELSDEEGLKVLSPVTARDAEFIGELKELSPDVIAVIAYGKILPEEILKLPKYGCINIHASLLPKYRGASPINRAILSGDKVTGVTTMMMDTGMDTGDILLTEEIVIEDCDTSETLAEKISKVGATLLIKTIEGVKSGAVKPRAQNDDEASYAPILKKEDGLIEWSMAAREVFDHVRGLKPWPGAFTYLDGKLLKIHSATCAEGEYTAGEVIEAAGGKVVVGCGSGSLEITELQLEGKRRMSAEEFLKSGKIKVGDKLGQLQ